MNKLNRSALLTAIAIATAAPVAAAQPFETNPLPEKRNLHGSVVVGDYLFAVSGDEPMPKGFTNTVLTARINDDLSIGAWGENRPLPINVIYIGNNVLSVGENLYVVGGLEVSDIPGAANPGTDYNQAANNTAIYAKVGANGQLGDWARSGRYPGNNGEGAAAATDGRFIYVMGGRLSQAENNQVTNTVYFAPIHPNGAVGQWKATSALPTPLWSHCAYAHNGTLYTLGGRVNQDSATITNAVQTATIHDDGTLGPWTVSPMALAYPVEIASACAADDFLFLFCGRTIGEKMVPKIQYAQLTSDGITSWKGVDTAITARCYASAALDRRRRAVYLTGGRFSATYTDLNNKVFAFPLRRPTPQAAPEVARTTNEFLPHDVAVARGREKGQPTFVFVYSNDIAFSRSELEKLSTSAEFQRGTSSVVLGMLEASANPQLVREMGVIRVPSYVMVGADGQLIAKASGRKSVQELITFVGK